MTHLSFPRWLIVPAIAFSVPAFSAQNTPIVTPTPPAATLPADPVVAAPAPVTPPLVTPPVVTPPPPIAPPVKKPPVPPKKVVKKADPGDSLRPGQFVWEKRAAYKNPLRIIAVLDFQRLYVFDGDELVAFTTISTGKKGHETPTGVFKILEKDIDHKSSIYDDAPMPFMQRLTWDGIALHAGKNPGYAASHGCIRLPAGFAQSLYRVTKLDQEVIVISDTSRAAQPSEQPKEAPKPQEPKPAETKSETAPALQPELPSAPKITMN
jgi:lipoprotein-anchoring transpeptidase ErfK/SrfK